LSCLFLSGPVGHFSPLFPLLKIVSRFPASRPTWSGAYDTRRASSSLSSLSLPSSPLPSSPSSIIIVMVSSTTLFIVLLALALAWAWAWRLLWSLVMAGHGSPWVSSPCISLSFVVMGHGSVRPKASISISSGHGRPCRITAMELFSGHLLAGLSCHVRAFPSLLLFSAAKSKHPSWAMTHDHIRITKLNSLDVPLVCVALVQPKCRAAIRGRVSQDGMPGC
jgi:hypothetical protein